MRRRSGQPLIRTPSTDRPPHRLTQRRPTGSFHGEAVADPVGLGVVGVGVPDGLGVVEVGDGVVGVGVGLGVGDTVLGVGDGVGDGVGVAVCVGCAGATRFGVCTG